MIGFIFFFLNKKCSKMTSVNVTLVFTKTLNLTASFRMKRSKPTFSPTVQVCCLKNRLMAPVCGVKKNFQNFRCDLCGPTWRETFFELLRGLNLGMIRTKINKLPFKPANRPKNQEDVRTVLKCEILCRYSHVPNLIVCSFEISKSVEKILYDVIIIYCWKLFMMSNRTSFSKRPSTFR